MAKPDQPKDIKPKEGAAKAPIDNNMKMIIISLITTVLICGLFVSINYVLLSNMLGSKLAKITANQNSDSEEGADDSESDASQVQHGFILDLGDFILNLSDAAPRKYLKVNVALEVSNKPEDAKAAEAGGKKEGGEGGGEKGAAAASPLDAEMAQYKPAIRDAVITTLSSKTSSELATTAGKELAKEQISEAVNGIFAGDRNVLRVSFGEFIIQ